jgi:pimeloyl-ACP methyl ester carboxylesterase
MIFEGVRELRPPTTVGPASALPRGRVVLRVLPSDPRLRGYFYWPTRATRNAPLLVAVHGISRNAREQARLLTGCAERYGVVLYAPVFGVDFFPDFQRLGRRGLRPDQALHRLLDDFGRLTGLSTSRFFLYGFSGGGQFGHRYAMAYPQRVAGLVVTAPGWYTWPDETRAYPIGMGHCDRLPDLQFDLGAFLRIPVTVMVGAADTERDPALRQSAGVDRRQGRNRFERGRRWVRRLRQEAEKRGLPPRARFHVLERSAHDFVECIRLDQMDQQIFQRLFDKGASPSASAG